MPRADDVPSFKVSHARSRRARTIRSARRAAARPGAIGAPAAMMNAVHDALPAVGVKRIDMPASPHRVWQAIQSARA